MKGGSVYNHHRKKPVMMWPMTDKWDRTFNQPKIMGGGRLRADGGRTLQRTVRKARRHPAFVLFTPVVRSGWVYGRINSRQRRVLRRAGIQYALAQSAVQAGSGTPSPDRPAAVREAVLVR